MSHDIKTPLTSIINYVDILKRSDITDEKIRGYLDILEAKAQRLKTLTEDVVEASKVSSGNITLEYMDVDLRELVQQDGGRDRGEVLCPESDSCSQPARGTCGYPCGWTADVAKSWRISSEMRRNTRMPGTRVYADLNMTEEKGLLLTEKCLRAAAEHLRR